VHERGGFCRYLKFSRRVLPALAVPARGLALPTVVAGLRSTVAASHLPSASSCTTLDRVASPQREARETSCRDGACFHRLVTKTTGRDKSLPVAELNGLPRGRGHCDRSWPTTLRMIGSEIVHAHNGTQ
jgi:hypothetical protein